MTLDTGGDAVRVLVRYSCHCWSSGWDGGGPPPEFLIMDGNRARVFDRTRFDASLELPDLIAALPEIQVYVTRSERNYGCCRGGGAPVAREAYTAYFTMRPRKGRFDGFLRAVVAAARRGSVVRYRRP